MNTDVYTGANGSVLLSTPEGVEGEAAQQVLSAHDLVVVGRVQDIRVEVRSAVRAYHEIGQRYATQLRPGNVTVTADSDSAADSGGTDQGSLTLDDGAVIKKLMLRHLDADAPASRC